MQSRFQLLGAGLGRQAHLAQPPVTAHLVENTTTLPTKLRSHDKALKARNHYFCTRLFCWMVASQAPRPTPEMLNKGSFI